MRMETDPHKVAELAQQREESNWAFRRFLKELENCALCPIVFNVFEQLKRELWRRQNRD